MSHRITCPAMRRLSSLFLAFFALLLAPVAHAQTMVRDSVKISVFATYDEYITTYRPLGRPPYDVGTCTFMVIGTWPDVLANQGIAGSYGVARGVGNTSTVALSGIVNSGANKYTPEGFKGIGSNTYGSSSWDVANPYPNYADCSRRRSLFAGYAAGAGDWYAVYSLPDGMPVALFEFDADNGLTVAFDGSFESGQSREIDASAPAGKRPVVGYAWDFGDGQTGSGAAPSHVYADSGRYDVTLTVTDDDGQTDTFTQEVHVQKPGLVVWVERTEGTPERYAKGDTISVTTWVENRSNEIVVNVKVPLNLGFVSTFPDSITTANKTNPSYKRVSDAGLTTATIPDVPSGERRSIVSLYRVEQYGIYRGATAYQSTAVESFPAIYGGSVTGELGYFGGPPVQVDEKCNPDVACGEDWTVAPRQLDVRLTFSQAAGSSMRTGFGVHRNRAGGFDVGFEAGGTFLQGPWPCQSGCLDFDVQVLDKETGEAVSTATNVTIQLTATAPTGANVVNPAGTGGEFCYENTAGTAEVCGSTLTVPAATVNTLDEPMNVRYYLPGIVGPEAGLPVTLTVRISSSTYDYEPFEHTHTAQAIPNRVVHRERSATANDIAAINAAGFFNALTSGTFVNAGYATGLKAISDGCKWLTATPITKAGEFVEFQQAGSTVGKAFSEWLCKQVDERVEEGVLTQFFRDAQIEQEVLRGRGDLAAASDDATTYFQRLKDYGKIAQVLGMLPNAISSVWMSYALDIPTTGLGETKIFEWSIIPPSISVVLAHESKFFTESSTFAQQLFAANSVFAQSLNYDLSIYEVTAHKANGTPKYALYVNFKATVDGAPFEHNALVDANYLPSVWLPRVFEDGIASLDAALSPGDATLPPTSGKASVDTTFATGDVIVVGAGTAYAEINQIRDADARTLVRPLRHAHAAGERIALGGNRPVMLPAPPYTRAPAGAVSLDSSVTSLHWYPMPLAQSYDVQAADDSLFSQLVLDQSGIVDTTVTIANTEAHRPRFWRVRARNLVGVGPWSWVERYIRTSVTTSNEEETAPTNVTLAAPYPNPSRSAAVLRYELPQAAAVRLAVYDVLGREVAVVVNETRSAGRHEAAVNVAGWSPGVYVVRLSAGETTAMRRLVVAR